MELDRKDDSFHKFRWLAKISSPGSCRHVRFKEHWRSIERGVHVTVRASYDYALLINHFCYKAIRRRIGEQFTAIQRATNRFFTINCIEKPRASRGHARIRNNIAPDLASMKITGSYPRNSDPLGPAC